MNCKTQRETYGTKIQVIITEFGEHYGKCLGSTFDRNLASKVRKKLKEDKITMSEAIDMLRGK